MVTATISDVRAQAMLNDLSDALIGQGGNGDAAVVLEQEFKLLMRQIVHDTAPFGNGSAAKVKGEDAVKKDLGKIFTGINEEMINDIGSQFGVSGIDRWITNSDGKPMHLIWDRLDPSGVGMPGFHKQNFRPDSHNGHTYNLKRKNQEGAWYSPYVVSMQDFTAYLKRIKGHIGRKKAAWAVSLARLGDTVPAWIGRHFGSANRGNLINNLSSKNPSLTAVSWAAGLTAEDHRIVKDAFAKRRGAMKKKIALITSGYSKDVANGIRITRKARKEPPPADA